MPYTDDKVGWQRTDTSHAAAADIGSKAATLRTHVLAVLRSSGRPMTTEEIAAAMDVDYVSVQPRTSELRNRDLIHDSGSRAVGGYGKLVIRWALGPKLKEDKQ